MAQNISYHHVETILIGRDGLMSAAEAHGLLVGMICINPDLEGESWLEEVMRDAEISAAPSDEEKTVLALMFVETHQLYEEESYEFNLLLPDDDESLQVRVEALGAWCRGFVYGLGCRQEDDPWPEDCDESVRDIVQISRIDSEAEGEADEVSFMELSEFVRVAVQLIRTEMRDAS